jgi:DHA2 family multidrug resistance protein
MSASAEDATPPPAAAPVAGPGELSSATRSAVAIAVALGTFIQVLDTTIANVSIPVIAGNLGVSADQGTWVITSFAVANGITVPLTGWLMQRFGLVRTYVASVLLFTVASFLCGIAWSLPSLLAFRVMQGAVSGPLIPGSQAVLLWLFPPRQRTLALAVWSMTTLAAPIAGPSLGGWISDNIGWPWIFLINVPVGIASAFVCWSGVGRRDTPGRRVPVDAIGLGLLIVWVGALQVLLDKGKDADWFASPTIVVLAIVAVVGFAAFVIWELTERFPIVDLRLFSSRNFAIGASVTCLGYALFFANVVLLPLWMQTQLGYNATWAGLAAAPSGVVGVLLTPLVGRALARVDARWIASASMVAFGTSYLMRAGLNAEASYWDFVAPMLMQGVGMAMFFISFVALTLNGVTPQRTAAAAGVANFMRITAGGFGASIVTTFWSRHAAFHQSRLAERTSLLDPPMREALTRLDALGGAQTQALALLARTLGREAYAKAALDFFWISGWMAFGLIAFIWFTRSTLGAARPPPAAD